MMKTSSRIALQFATWIAILVGCLFIFMNLFFFWGRVNSDAQNLSKYMAELGDETIQKQPTLHEGIVHFQNVGKNTFKPTDYPHYLTIHWIRFISDRRRMVGVHKNEYIGLDVSQNIARQRGLIIMSGILWLIVSGGSFVLGTMFVRRSLRDLIVLKKKLDKRNVESPEGSLYASHLPVDDEINSIAHAITKLETRVQSHYGQLRDFVGHVSHELKTPLMEMRSDLDVINRTQSFDKLPLKVHNHIIHMQRIIDTMLLLTRLDEKTPVATEQLSLLNIVQPIIDSLQKVHNNRNPFLVTYDNDIVCQGHPELVHTLLTNILDNACKYSQPQSPITLTITGHTIIITNHGSLTENTLQNMREPFWQADKNRTDGLGIGLALVKQIAHIHKREIEYRQDGNIVVADISCDHAYT